MSLPEKFKGTPQNAAPIAIPRRVPPKVHKNPARYAERVNATQGWPGLDPTTPNVARMYDYYLGGKDNFEADRVAAKKVLALFPGLRQGVQGNRRFLRRVVRFLAAEAGVTQFLDIGVGLPTQGAVHEIAQQVSPDARVVYVDYDPVVVAHGHALLEVDDLSIMVRADARRPEELIALPDIRAHLDFTQPVAIILFATLYFMPDADDPARVITTLRDAVAPGSYLAIGHIGTEFFPDKKALARAVKVYEGASEQIHPRTREQILDFFDGWRLLEPGLVPKDEWRPDPADAAADTPNIQWGAVGQKP
jgi:S-adenosyl methyltransferase